MSLSVTAGAVADSGPFLLNVPAGQMLWIPLKEDIKWQWPPLFFRSVLVGSVPLPAASVNRLPWLQLRDSQCLWG